MNRLLLNTLICLFFLGGLFGFTVGLLKFFGGGGPAEYGVMGIGGGFWLLSSAITIYISERISPS
jgi:hypothetical protein